MKYQVIIFHGTSMCWKSINHNYNYFLTIGSKFSKLGMDQANSIARTSVSVAEYMLQKNRKPMTSTERNQKYRERKRQEKQTQKKSANSLMIENNKQNLSIITTDAIPTSNFSKQNEQQLSTNFLSPSSNISSFNLLHLTNSGHNNHILPPNSSSIELSEIISSVDIDRDNFIADHISSSSNVISGSF